MKGRNISEFVEETEIPGLVIVKRPTFVDERGFFREVTRLSDLESVGIKFAPVQVNHSLSVAGTIRAIHTETINKLVYPLTGRMFAAFVDVRTDSAAFGKVITINFDSLNKASETAVFIPKGVGNSICSIGPDPLHYIYLVDGYWTANGAQGIAWDDPDLDIKWPIKDPIISERDRNNPTMIELFPEKFR